MEFREMLAQCAVSDVADASLREWLEKYNINYDENFKRRTEMSDKKSVHISFNKAFVKENIKTKDGETFHSVMIPRGVTIDGVDRGLYRFTTRYINDDKFNDNNRLVSFPADYEIKLTLSRKTESGKWEQADSITVTSKKLKEAVLQQRKEYMESHKGKEQEEGQAENSDFEEDDLPFEEEPEEEVRMVDTNIGRMPIEDYRENIAMHYGFDSYADLRSQGGCIGHGMDEEEPEL